MKLKDLINNWLPVLVVALIIFGLSSLHGQTVDDIGLNQNKYQVNGHFVLYFLLYITLFRATKSYGASFILAFLYSLSDEFHQSFVPGRAVQTLDIIVDSLGALIAALFIWKFSSYLPQKLKNWLTR